MPLRLLLVLLMSAGPSPVRVCTCAAGTHAAASGEADTSDSDHHHPAHHDRDCPVAKSTAQVVAGEVRESSEPPPQERVELLPVLGECSAPVRVSRPSSDPHPGRVPIYISLLTLRN